MSARRRDRGGAVWLLLGSFAFLLACGIAGSLMEGIYQ